MSLASRLLRVLPVAHQIAISRRRLPGSLKRLPRLPYSVEREIHAFNSRMNTLPGGWCPLHKQYALASLALSHRCTRAVEIGVFQGGSLLPIAAAMRLTGGMVTGIDPYSSVAAEQQDNRARFVPIVGPEWHRHIDWEALYVRVEKAISYYQLGAHCRLVRATATDGAASIEAGLDLLHIDGNHDSDAVLSDIRNYVPKVRTGGLIVLDDTNWDTIHPQYLQLKQNRAVLYEAHNAGEERPEWAVLQQN